MSRTFIAASLLVLLPAALTAQPAPGQPGASRYLQVVALAIEPGQGAAWEAYEQQVQDARRQLGVDRNVLIYQVLMGNPFAQYYAVIAFSDLGEMEGWRSPAAVMAEVHGGEEAARMNPGATRVVENGVHEIQPDLSSGETLPGSRTRYVQVVETVIDPAREAEYRAFLRSLAAAEEAQGIRTARRVATLGPAFTFYTVTGYASLGDLRSGPPPVARLAEAVGQEVADDIWARGNAAVLSRRVFVMQLREDLSHLVN